MNQKTKGEWLLLLLLLFPLISRAEEVCKIAYTDFPKNLQNKTIEAPVNTVALSESVRIKKADDSSVVIMNTPAILFVLDNSGSMYVPHRNNSDTAQYSLALDPEGNRFSVTEAMIDSLYVQDPNAEVGLIVYGSELHFEKSDVVTTYIDPDDPFNFAKGAFVTFLQLNKQYTENSTTRTGYEFLKYYLETEELRDRIVFKDEDDTSKIILDTVVTYQMLKHITRTAINFDSGTDITMAFKGVKASLQHTSVEKHLQYTVFFSDGIPSSGGMEMWDFVKGEGIPTTYTIFFHPDKVAPDSLISMNNNIKTNNYSTSNENSELWAFDNSGHDALLDFMIENVLNKIKGEITTEPVEITINGKKSGDWKDGIFTFEELFPLTAEKSSFTFDIQYDVITTKSDNSTTIEKVHDTVDFFVQREGTPDLIDSLTVERWDRSITVRDGGTVISLIAEGTKEVELLFEEKKIDCNYQYEDIELEIQSINYGDRLTLPLNRLDAHRFSEMLSLDFKEGGDPVDDDKLQLFSDDEVTIFFQNGKLPLDTLTLSIATNVLYRLTFHEAVYFDKNGDGAVDLIRMPFQTNFDLQNAHIDDIVKAISLPVFRELSIDEARIEGKELLLTVTEGSGKIQTYVTSEDIVSVKSTEIDFFELKQSTVSVIDSMAPVLQDTTVLVTRSKDHVILRAQFSEELQAITNTKPLRFYHGETPFFMILDRINSTTYEYSFSVKENANELISGDSVNIWSGALLTDPVGNRQENDSNVKRKVVIEDKLSFSQAVFYDKNSDGHVDLLSLQLDFFGDSLKISPDSLVKQLLFPEYRQLEVEFDRLVIRESSLFIPVLEKSESINTACTSEDVLRISGGVLGDYVFSDDTLVIIDSMAPVISEDPVIYLNTMDDDIPDTVKLHFSEEVSTIESEQPFRFFHNGASFLGSLSLEEHNKKRAVFSVHSFDGGVEELFAGDSINIHNSIFDIGGNEQKDPQNVKRPLTVSIVLPPIEFELKAVTPFNPQTTVVPHRVIESVDDLVPYKLSQNDSGFVGELITLSVTPKSVLTQLDCTLEAEFTILDKVGNVILEKQQMEYLDEISALVYLWNGKNSLGRVVGKDSFLLVCHVRLAFSDGQTFEVRKELILATQEE